MRGSPCTELNPIVATILIFPAGLSAPRPRTAQIETLEFLWIRRYRHAEKPTIWRRHSLSVGHSMGSQRKPGFAPRSIQRTQPPTARWGSLGRFRRKSLDSDQ